MCSASHPGIATRDRVLGVAITAIGRDGVKETTVRKIAHAADVSAALVLHHFGSKQGLLDACDERVLAVTEAAVAALTESGGNAGVQGFLAIDGATEALAYIGRSMQDGGPAGRTWFARMMEMTLDGLRTLESDGAARHSEDPTMRALLLIAMDLGVILLRPLVTDLFGRDIADPALTERWVREEMDLLSNGVLRTSAAAALAEPATRPPGKDST